MGDRKWEELPFDCLVDIFGRVGWVSLVEGVPFVCKSWYQVTLSPLCWQSLIFTYGFPGHFPLESSFVSFQGTFHDEAFIKFAIRRSHGLANEIALPENYCISGEVLRCIGGGCPFLKRLVLPCKTFGRDLNKMFSSMICKWRNLEALEIRGSGYLLNDIIPQISVHCKNFVSLTAIDVIIDESEAHAIVALLPNLKFLSLILSRIERRNVIIILKGCKNLVYFEVGFDFDFDGGFDMDDEILNLAAHIPTFEFDVKEIDDEDEDAYDCAKDCATWIYEGNSFDHYEGNFSDESDCGEWKYDVNSFDDEGYCAEWNYECYS